MGKPLEMIVASDFYVVNCGSCGGVYAILESVRYQKQIEGASWNCPYCQTGWGYTGNGENAKLKREIERERKRKEWAEQEARNERDRRHRTELQLRSQKGATTRVKNRVANGVCPCCTRSFSDLKRHMASKHPGYANSETV